MSTDFLTLLNSTNSYLDQSNNTIMITIPLIEVEGDIKLDKSCKLSSNCSTVIKCGIFEVLCDNISMSNINFNGSVFVKESNNFSIQNSSVTNSKNLDGSFTVYSSANVTISNLTISDTEIPGLYVKMQSTVKADHLNIQNLKETLVVCNSGSSITVSDSHLSQSKANGVYSGSQVSIEILNCVFKDIEYPAIFVEGTTCIVKNCSFDGVGQDGIALHSSTDFVIENNKFIRIKGSAISAGDESKGSIVNNEITQAEGNGIFIKKSEATIKENTISDTTFPAIAIILKSKASLFRNKVFKIEYNGIAVRGASDVTIDDNEIENVKESGISISDTEKCIVRKNSIKNCSIAAVEAYNKSQVNVSENDIKDMEKYAFLVYTSGYMKSENNSIENVMNSFVKLAFKGSGDFLNNMVKLCSNQCEIQTSSPFFFTKNGEFQGITNQKDKISDDVDFDELRVDDRKIMCLKCKDKKCDCYVLDCGHKVYCKECADSALKNHENCPLCRFPIVNVSNGFGVSKDDTCIICCENAPDCIILPCGHMGVCSNCLESWFETKQICPICRAENSIYKKIDNL